MNELLTFEQVAKGLAEASRLADRYLPKSFRPAASAAIGVLNKPEAVEAIQLLGAVGLARAYAWWNSVSPFSEPPLEADGGLDAALNRILDRAVAHVDRRDAERAAFSALTQALMEIGWEGAKAALPFVIAAVRK